MNWACRRGASPSSPASGALPSPPPTFWPRPMVSIRSTGRGQKVGGGLGRAPDAGELGGAPRRHAQFIEALDNPLRDGVVAAAGAKGRARPLVVENLQTNSIHLLRRRRDGGAHRPSWRTISSVTVRASSGKPP